MSELIDAMTPLVGHMEENIAYYLIGALFLGVFIFFTRRWTVPFILYTLEYSAYLVAMHVVVHYVTAVTGWFRNSSSMKALRPDGMPVDAVEWSTPFSEFWDKANYDPEWIFYVECGFAVVIFLLMLWLRPMKTQKPKSRYEIDGTKKSDSQNPYTEFSRDKYRADFLRAEEETKRLEALRKRKK